MKSNLIFSILEVVTNITPLMAFISLIPFTGLFLGDLKEFKMKKWPFVTSIVMFFVSTAAVILLTGAAGDSDYISLCIKVYFATAAISFFSACGLYLFITDQYYVFEFVMEYYIVGAFISLKNMFPAKTTMHRTAKVLISPNTWNQWLAELRRDSSLDNSYKPEKKQVEEEVYND